MKEVVKKTTDRLDAIKAEGVHVSEAPFREVGWYSLLKLKLWRLKLFYYTVSFSCLENQSNSIKLTENTSAVQRFTVLWSVNLLLVDLQRLHKI